MAISKKQRNYIRNYGKTDSVRQIARKLRLSRAQVREVLEELEAKGELRAQPPAPPVPLFEEKSVLSKHDYRWAAGAAVASFVVYLLTLAPDLTGEDSGELIAAAYTLGIAHPPGYPLWCALGKMFSILIPFGTIAYRVNFMSAFFAAGTIFFLFLIVRKITGNRFVAAAAALLFAFSDEFWSQSNIAEVYTLNSCFVAACLFLVLIWNDSRSRRLLYVLAFLCGLGCTNHHTMAPLSAVFAVWILYKSSRPLIPLKTAGIAVALFLAAFSVYLYLPIRARANPYMNWGNPATFKNFTAHVMRQQYLDAAAAEQPARSYQGRLPRFGRQMAVYGAAYVKQFTYLLFWLPALGLWLYFKRRRAEFYYFFSIFLVMSVGFVIFADFNPERNNIIQNDFLFIPSYMVASIWLAIALLWFWRVLQRKVDWKFVRVGAPVVALLLPVINLCDKYHENDKSSYHWTYDYGNALLDTMEKDAIIFPKSDYRVFPLLYFQGVLRQRPDVTIAKKYGRTQEHLYLELIEEAKRAGRSAREISLNEIERHIISKYRDRPVYFTNRPIGVDAGDFTYVPQGLLFRTVHKADLPKYAKKASEGYWKKCHLRNFADPPSRRDYSADMIIIDYHYMRALAYHQEGKTKKALQELDKLKQPAKGLKKVFNNVGNTLAVWGYLAQAVEFYEKSLSYDPYFLMAVRNLAKTYLHLKDYDNCARLLDRALDISPHDLDLHVLRTRMYVQKREFDNALFGLEETVRLFPNHYLPYRLLGIVYLDGKKDAKKAASYFKKSLKLKPNQPDLKKHTRDSR